MLANTMKAIQLHEFGGPEVLRYEDVAVPELKAGEVLVRVHAIGINPPDWYLREGYKDLPPDWRPEVSLACHPGDGRIGSRRGRCPGCTGVQGRGRSLWDDSLPQLRGEPCICGVHCCARAGTRTQAGSHRPRARSRGTYVWTYRVAILDRCGTRSSESTSSGTAPASAARGQDDTHQWCCGRRGSLRGATGEVEGCARHCRGIVHTGVLPARARGRTNLSTTQRELPKTSHMTLILSSIPSGVLLRGVSCARSSAGAHYSLFSWASPIAKRRKG